MRGRLKSIRAPYPHPCPTVSGCQHAPRREMYQKPAAVRQRPLSAGRWAESTVNICKISSFQNGYGEGNGAESSMEAQAVCTFFLLLRREGTGSKCLSVKMQLSEFPEEPSAPRRGCGTGAARVPKRGDTWRRSGWVSQPGCRGRRAGGAPPLAAVPFVRGAALGP